MEKRIITFGLTEGENNAIKLAFPSDDYELMATDAAGDLIAVSSTGIVINANNMNDEERNTVIDFYTAVDDAEESVHWIGYPKPPKHLTERIHWYPDFNEYMLLKNGFQK